MTKVALRLQTELNKKVRSREDRKERTCISQVGAYENNKAGLACTGLIIGRKNSLQVNSVPTELLTEQIDRMFEIPDSTPI